MAVIANGNHISVKGQHCFDWLGKKIANLAGTKSKKCKQVGSEAKTRVQQFSNQKVTKLHGGGAKGAEYI